MPINPAMRSIDIERTQDFQSPGERLSHILDHVGFPVGHGRVKKLQELLAGSEHFDFSDIKYGAVRGWFHENSPTMRKIGAILKTIQSEFEMGFDVEAAGVWWKMGGIYPFEKRLKKYSVDLLVSSFVMRAIDNDPTAINESQLENIKQKAAELYDSFADPNKTVCPEEYIRMLVESMLNKIK